MHANLSILIIPRTQIERKKRFSDIVVLLLLTHRILNIFSPSIPDASINERIEELQVSELMNA